MGTSFPTKSDNSLEQIQSTCISASAAMLNLWLQLEDQKMTSGQGGLVPVEVVLNTIQKSAALTGNALNCISEAHRDFILSRISKRQRGLGKVIKSVCRATKHDGSVLFGPSVHRALTECANTQESVSSG